MSAIVICLVLLMCTLTIRISALYVLMVECMTVVVNVMFSLMSVMSPPLPCSASTLQTCHETNKASQSVLLCCVDHMSQDSGAGG